MKKHFFLPLSLLLIIPLYTHAAEDISMKLVSTSTEEVASSTEESSKNTPDQDFTLCQQQAIEARDTQISLSRSLYNTAMTNALSDRKNKEKAAVAISTKDDKKEAIKISVDTYKSLTKKAQNDLTEARKTAWQTFENEIQACRDAKNVSEEESPTSLVVDENKEVTSKNISDTPTKNETKEVTSEGSSFKSIIKAFKSLFD
jgi:DNA repair ATPase RecN